MSVIRRAQWPRSSDSRLKGPSAALLKPWGSVFTLHYITLYSFSYIKQYLTINSCGYVYEQPVRTYCNIWLDVSQRS